MARKSNQAPDLTITGQNIPGHKGSIHLYAILAGTVTYRAKGFHCSGTFALISGIAQPGGYFFVRGFITLDNHEAHSARKQWPHTVTTGVRFQGVPTITRPQT